MVTYIVFDVETTGLIPYCDHITEVGAVALLYTEKGMSYIKDKQFYYDIKNGEEEDRIFVADKLRSWLRCFTDKNVYGLSYNTPFDHNFLKMDPWYVDDELCWDIDGCVMQLTRESLYLENPVKLCEALDLFNIPYHTKKLHNALYDAKMAARLMIKIINEGYL